MALSIILTSASTASILIITISSYIYYRLYLDPLAQFPGPALAALTRYYEAYYDVIRNGQYTFKIEELHKKYGPIIRISPYELHINDSSYFETLYSQSGRWNKYAWSYSGFCADMATTCTPDHELHRLRRGPLNPFFSKVNVASRQDIVWRATGKLCSRLDEFAEVRTTPVNLGAAISAFTRDIGSEFILGKSYKNLDTKDFNAAMTGCLDGIGAVWRITKHITWFGHLMKLLPSWLIQILGDEGTKSFYAFLQDTMQLTVDTISSHVAGANDELSRTMISEILASNLPPTEKTVARLNDEIGTILGAAFETTAHSIRAIVYYAYNDAEILRNLRMELAQAREQSRNPASMNIDLATLEQLPYLTAVLMEGLRLSPGLASRMARIAPDRDLIYGEWRIPAGTPVGMTTIMMHMDEKVYPEPNKFKPERWINTEMRRQLGRKFAPFSKGTRICLGMHLAWAELYILLSALVQRFDLELEESGLKNVECVSDQFIIGTKDRNGIEAFVRKRSL